MKKNCQSRQNRIFFLRSHEEEQKRNRLRRLVFLLVQIFTDEHGFLFNVSNAKCQVLSLLHSTIPNNGTLTHTARVAIYNCHTHTHSYTNTHIHMAHTSQTLRFTHKSTVNMRCSVRSHRSCERDRLRRSRMKYES